MSQRFFAVDNRARHAAGVPRGSPRLRDMGVALPAAVLWLAALLALPCGPAAADVFMWKDPATGKTRMTNIAPPWLREPKPGVRIPKVEVIRGGKVLDPAAAFATPEAQPVSTRRRDGDQNQAADSGTTGRPAVQNSGPAIPISLPPGVRLPPGFQLPFGTTLVPAEAAQPAPGAPTAVSR